MDKLTTDNVFEMNTIELALNQVFVRDGWAWYRRAPEDECSVCDLIRSVAANGMRQDSIEFDPGLTDEELGDIMLDWLQFGENEPEGVLAILYRALWAMAELRERLKRYEDNGLEPEEIKERLQAGKELFFEYSELYNEVGSIDHLRELAQAEKDGRLIAHLPGETVYNRFGAPWIIESSEIHLIQGQLKHLYRCGHPGTEDYYAMYEDEIKTCEEAEAALKKREEAK